MRGDEVLQNGQSFAEGGADGQLDGAAGRVRHKTAHTRELTDLTHVASGAGVRHHPDGVEIVKPFDKLFFDGVGSVLPDLDDGLITLLVGDDTALEIAFDVDDFLLGVGDYTLLVAGDVHIEHAGGYRADGGVLVAKRLDLVEHARRLGRAVVLEAVVDDHRELLFADGHRLLAEHFEHGFAQL